MKRIFLATLAAGIAALWWAAPARAQIAAETGPVPNSVAGVPSPNSYCAGGFCTPHSGSDHCCEPRKIGVPEVITVPRFSICYGCTCRYMTLPCPTCNCTCNLCGWQDWFKNLCCCGCCNSGHACAQSACHEQACPQPQCGHVRKVNVLMKRKVLCGEEQIVRCNVVDAPPEPCQQHGHRRCCLNPLNWFCRPHANECTDPGYSAPVTAPVSIPSAVPSPEPLPAPQIGPAGLAPMPSNATLIPATPAVPVSTVPDPSPPGEMVDQAP